jgi:hypothetical protein
MVAIEASQASRSASGLPLERSCSATERISTNNSSPVNNPDELLIWTCSLNIVAHASFAAL